MEKYRIVFLLMGFLALKIIPVSGLKDSDSCKFHIYTVNTNETAILNCPGVKIKDAYAIVHFKKCPSAGDFDDGHDCRWIAGRTRQGKADRKDKRLHITSDGALRINKAHLNDTARYKCTVENANNKDPERHFMMLIVNDKQPPTNGCPVRHNNSSYVENGTSARGPGINNTGPGSKEMDIKKDAKDSDHTSYLIIIAALASLIAAAEGGFIMYLKHNQQRTVSCC